MVNNNASDARIEYVNEMALNKADKRKKVTEKAIKIAAANQFQYCEACTDWYDFTITPCCPRCGN